MIQLINLEKFTNIQKAQAGLTRLFMKAKETASFYRVMRNDEPVGVLVPTNLWDSLTEDLEALSSPGYFKKIAESRADKTRVSSLEAKRKLGVK